MYTCTAVCSMSYTVCVCVCRRAPSSSPAHPHRWGGAWASGWSAPPRSPLCRSVPFLSVPLLLHAHARGSMHPVAAWRRRTRRRKSVVRSFCRRGERSADECERICFFPSRSYVHDCMPPACSSLRMRTGPTRRRQSAPSQWYVFRVSRKYELCRTEGSL